MIKKRSNTILWIGLMGTLLIGTFFITDVCRAFWGNHNIWWTHRDMRLPIEQTKNNFELYLGGIPLQTHLSHGTLFFVDKNGKQYPLVSKDITVRINNWDRTKSSILTNTTIMGFAFGVSVTFLLIGLIQFYPHKKINDRGEG